MINTKVHQQKGNTAPGRGCTPAGRITARQTRISRQAGFNLTELLITMTIVAVVSAIAIPSYSGYSDRVDIAAAESDIRGIEQALEQFYFDNNGYPDSLSEIDRDGMQDPWGKTYKYLKIAGASGTVNSRLTTGNVPVNSDYDLYSDGKNELTNINIYHSKSLDDVIRGRDGRFIGPADDF